MPTPLENLNAIQDALLDAEDISKRLNRSFQTSSASLNESKRYFTSANTLARELLEIENKLGTSYVNRSNLEKRLSLAKGVQESIGLKLINLEKGLSSAQQKNIEEFKKGNINNDQLIKKLVSSQRQDLKKQQALEVANYLITQKSYSDQENAINDINKRIHEQNALYTKQEFKLHAISKIFGTLSKIPILGDLIDFKTVEERVNATEGNVKKIGVAFSETLKSLFNTITSPLAMLVLGVTLISKLVSAVLEMDKGMTNVKNSMGLSNNSAQGLYDTFRKTSIEGSKYSTSLDNAFLSITNQVDALGGLQQAFGTSAMFSNEMLENQILLTKQMGMEADEAAGIQRLGMLNKQSAESILNSAVKNNTANISYRKIISEIAKVNAEISAAYKNNPDLLAKAVVQAAKLGMTLEETRKISDSLLDFESSISNELEAELLTGKQLNFEKARALALDGKSSEAAAELMNQMGGLNRLTQMNTLQRAAMAKSIGMTSSELMKAVQQEEILKALGFDNEQQLRNRYDLLKSVGKNSEAAALLDDIRKQKNGEMMAQDISRANLSQRFEESMNRVKEIFIQIASGPILNILNSFAKLLSNADTLKSIVKGIEAAAVTAAVAFAIMNPAAALAGLAIVGSGMLAASMASSTKTASDTANIVTPSTPTSAIEPNATSAIVPSNNTQASISGDSNGSTAGIENRLDKIASIMSKGGNVYIDSTRSGTAHGMSYNSYA